MVEKAKFQFNGQTYTVKGRLCHDIVKYYVEQNPNATLTTLQKAFNTTTHMIVATTEMALTIVNSDGKAGGDYYMKEADQISIKKGKVVVWSYWPESYFKPFMEQVKALGLDVVVKEDEKKTEVKAPDLTAEQSSSPVMEILNEIKEKMERCGLDRLGIYASDCCPEEMDWDEFEEKYADELDSQSNFSIEYSDIEEGYSWQNILLRTIKLGKGEILFGFQTVIGNNDEDPSEELDYDEDKTINDLLGYDEGKVLEVLETVKSNIDTFIEIQQDTNNR